VLSYTDYKRFYQLVEDAKRGQGNQWYCEDWKQDVKDALCAVDNTQPECQPEEYAQISHFLDILVNDCGAKSFFGANWNAQQTCLCDTVDDDLVADCNAFVTSINQNYSSTVNRYRPKEVSHKQWYHYF